MNSVKSRMTVPQLTLGRFIDMKKTNPIRIILALPFTAVGTICFMLSAWILNIKKEEYDSEREKNEENS